MSIRYKKAPITEAILDIRIEATTDASAVDIALGLSKLSNNFPNRSEIPFSSRTALPIGVLLPVELTGSRALAGFRYESEDGQRVVEARTDGFVFSFLGTTEKRYPGWQAFSEEALSIWAQYKETWPVNHIVRVALRYVNHLDVTDSDLPFSERFALLPQPPRPEFLSDEGILGFGLNITLQSKDDVITIINYRVSDNDGTDNTLILDIDVFSQGIEISPDDAESLTSLLSTLRTQKNNIFRACMTEAAERKLEPINE